MDEEKPEPEPAVEPKSQEDERTFVEKFITKAKPQDWMTLKEESSYPVPIPNLLKYLAVIQGFFIVAIIAFLPVIYFFYMLLGESPGNINAIMGLSSFVIQLILLIGMIGGNMLNRFLTVNKPKNWKKHLCFIGFSFNTLIIGAPLWYWYFYRKSNVAEYYKQFENK